MTNDAMSPTLKKGDQLLVSTSSRRVIGDEGLWAINYGGSNLVRRLMPLPRGEGYRVSADNPSAPSFEASTEDIQLRGLVFWCGRMLS
jgi:phage repressor protein C with HTH and peptisase S24 domain